MIKHVEFIAVLFSREKLKYMLRRVAPIDQGGGGTVRKKSD